MHNSLGDQLELHTERVLRKMRNTKVIDSNLDIQQHQASSRETGKSLTDPVFSQQQKMRFVSREENGTCF